MHLRTGCLATIVLVGSVAFTHAAEVTRPVGGVKVNFPILNGYCLAEDNNARDALFIKRMATLLGSSKNRLIVLSMDCGRQLTWRNGVEGDIYDYSSYYIPEKHFTPTLKGDKAAFRKALCNDMRKQGDATLAPNKDMVAKAEKELNENNLAASSTKMIGVVGEDQHACYSALLVGLRTATDNILMSALSSVRTGLQARALSSWAPRTPR